MPDLHRYSVGEPYSLVRSSWPESPQFNHRAGVSELVMFYTNPSPAEMFDARRGEAEVRGRILWTSCQQGSGSLSESCL